MPGGLASTILIFGRWKPGFGWMPALPTLSLMTACVVGYSISQVSLDPKNNQYSTEYPVKDLTSDFESQSEVLTTCLLLLCFRVSCRASWASVQNICWKQETVNCWEVNTYSIIFKIILSRKKKMIIWNNESNFVFISNNPAVISHSVKFLESFEYFKKY